MSLVNKQNGPEFTNVRDDPSKEAARRFATLTLLVIEDTITEVEGWQLGDIGANIVDSEEQIDTWVNNNLVFLLLRKRDGVVESLVIYDHNQGILYLQTEGASTGSDLKDTVPGGVGID